MIKCFNINSLQRANTFDDLLDQTLQPDFAGWELNLDQNLGLYPEIEEETLASVGEKARVKNVKISSLTTCCHDLFNLCSENQKTRNDALEYFKNLIDCAAPFGAITIIPAHQIQTLGSIPSGSYEYLFNHLFFSLKSLAAHAEKKSLPLALETPGSGLLLSPLELRELIDQVNNPYMGVCLNPFYLEKNGRPLDWFTILGKRIFILHLNTQNQQKCQSILDALTNKKTSIPVVYVSSQNA